MCVSIMRFAKHFMTFQFKELCFLLEVNYNHLSYEVMFLGCAIYFVLYLIIVTIFQLNQAWALGNIQPVSQIRPVRPFYATRLHLQKYKLLSQINPKTFYFFIGHPRTNRPFLLFTP